MSYIDGLPPATRLGTSDLVIVDQGSTGVPGTATTKSATITQLINAGMGLFPSQAANVGLSVATLADTTIFQRSTVTGGANGKGVGNIRVTVTLLRAASFIEYRLRDSVAPNTTLQDWSVGAYAVPAGTNTITLGGAPARAGWYLVDLRPNGDNAQILLGTTRVGMGRLIAASGQSLAVRMFGRMDGQSATLASLGITPSPNSSVYAAYSDAQRSAAAAWATPADGTSYDATFCAEFLRLEVAASGVNCALIGYSVGGTSILTWIPGGVNNTPLHTNIAATGGMFEAFCWMQGHADAGTSMSNAAYQANMALFFADMQAANGLTSFTKLIASIPNTSSIAYGTASVETIRAASASWASGNGGVAVTPMDIDLIDGIHQSMAGGVSLARHFYRASRPGLSLTGAADVGPVITGAVARTTGSATIKLTMALAGGTAITSAGNPLSRFEVFNRGAVTGALTINSLSIISPTEVDLVLSAAPADTQALDVWAFYPPDPSPAGATNMLFDNNVSDSDGLAVGRSLTPTLTPIFVDSPAASITVNLPPSVAPTVPMTISGIYSGPPPVGIDFRFDAAAYGAATSPVISGQVFSFTTTSPSAGTHTVSVRESNATGVTSTSGSFLVGSFGPTLVMTTPTWGTVKFSQGLTGGSGLTSVAGPGPSNGIGTYECWIKTSSATGTQVCFSQQNMFYLGAASGKALGAYGGAGSTVTVSSTTTISDNVLHHLALVVEAGGGTLYVDGVVAGTNATPVASAGVLTNGHVGVNTLAGGFLWLGATDEGAIFNLSKYTAPFTPPSSAYTGAESGLLCVWHLDGDGTSVT